MTKTNGFDSEKAGEFLGRCENLRRETDSKKGEYMAFCKAQREAENEVLAEAKEAGFSKKALKGLLKQRELSRKIDRITDGFEADDQSQFDSLEEKLGGLAALPLGQAAIAAADKKPKKEKVGNAKNTATTN